MGTSVKMVIRVYGHHHPDFQKDAARSLGRARR
jgi:hypothetical protein